MRFTFCPTGTSQKSSMPLGTGQSSRFRFSLSLGNSLLYISSLGFRILLQYGLIVLRNHSTRPPSSITHSFLSAYLQVISVRLSFFILLYPSKISPLLSRDSASWPGSDSNTSIFRIPSSLKFHFFFSLINLSTAL